MKAFQFRLQTKLKVCLRQEQLAKEELQQSLLQYYQAQEELHLLEKRMLNLERAIREDSHGIGPDSLIKREYLPMLNLQLKEAQYNLQVAEEILEKSRTELVEKKKETQIIDKLREQEWGIYIRECHLEEQKTIDEVAQAIYYRKEALE